MGNTILLIDDDVELCGLFELLLTQKGYQVHTALDGISGLKMLYSASPDVIVLDVMMPGIDGWETCSRIREITDTPIIMLTAVNEQTEIVKGLNLGADDYLVKPIFPDALVARIEAVLRRVYREQKDSGNHRANTRKMGRRSIISCNNVAINIDKYEVTSYGQRVDLSPTEYRLLSTLARFKGRVLSHSYLISEVSGGGHTFDIYSLRLYIKQLRGKLEEDPKNPKLIQTEWGIGYRFG